MSLRLIKDLFSKDIVKISFALFIAASITSLFLSAVFLKAEEASPFIYDSKGKRDPFIPLVASQVRTYSSLENIETIEDLILEGILWDPRGGSAVILNGIILKEDEELNNVIILKITPKKVFLKINDRDFEISLEEKEEWK